MRHVQDRMALKYGIADDDVMKRLKLREERLRYQDDALRGLDSLREDNKRFKRFCLIVYSVMIVYIIIMAYWLIKGGK